MLFITRLGLSPRPADLTAHAVPEGQTDTQLFDWITNGDAGPHRLALG